jgi:hypothetical protein
MEFALASGGEKNFKMSTSVLNAFKLTAQLGLAKFFIYILHGKLGGSFIGLRIRIPPL